MMPTTGTVGSTTRLEEDPVAASIMARLDPPEHGPDFWERLVEEFEAVGRRPVR
jgi:hypothetical protein